MKTLIKEIKPIKSTITNEIILKFVNEYLDRLHDKLVELSQDTDRVEEYAEAIGNILCDDIHSLSAVSKFRTDKRELNTIINRLTKEDFKNEL